MKMAQTIKAHVENLAAALLTGQSPYAATSELGGKLDDVLHGKLAGGSGTGGAARTGSEARSAIASIFRRSSRRKPLASHSMKSRNPWKCPRFPGVAMMYKCFSGR